MLVFRDMMGRRRYCVDAIEILANMRHIDGARYFSDEVTLKGGESRRRMQSDMHMIVPDIKSQGRRARFDMRHYEHIKVDFAEHFTIAAISLDFFLIGCRCYYRRHRYVPATGNLSRAATILAAHAATK